MNRYRSNFMEHLIELRNRVIICAVFFILAFVVCYIFSDDLYRFLLKPLINLERGNNNFSLIYTSLTETFFVYVEVAAISAFMISAPFFEWHMYRFLAPGLYRSEKNIILPYIIAVPVLFYSGATMVYLYIFPMAWKFFITFGMNNSSTESVPIEFMPSVSQYLDLVVQLMLAFGIAFQLPVVLTLLAITGLVSSSWLMKKRRIAIVLIFTAAAFLTPPDVLSQICLAIPMLLLYEGSVVACKYIENRRASTRTTSNDLTN